jgi:hypothetical protein
MYEASEERWYADPLRIPKSVRRRVHANFDERLKIAQEAFLDLYSGSSEPLITPAEAVVLSIGHSYRNAAYHRDTHNPAVVLPLAKVLFDAVSAAFVRAHSGSGYYLPSTEGPVCDEPPEAIAARLQEGLEVPLEGFSKVLADDLTNRADQLVEWVGYLPIGEDDLERGLADEEFLDKHGADDELMALDDEWNPRMRAVRGQPMPTCEEFEQAREKIQARVAELRKLAGPPTVTLRHLVSVRHAANVIESADDLPSALSAYQEADRVLLVLEKYIGEAVDAYDRHIDMQMDIERGK